MVLAKLKTRSLLSNRRADCTKYTYDAALNRQLMIDSNSTTTYTCDVAIQLNLIVETTGRTTISYDANGNQILQVMPVLSRTTNVWDGDNRLANVVHSSTDRSTYSYWSDSLRVSAVENGAIVKFTWDEQRYLQEANAVNETQALFTSEPTLYGSLISQTRSLTTFFHTDSTGSVTYLTDVDS
ncbi:MAG TPA: hypothetical protein PLX97_00570, partial [Gemmatales bacterium]|nr:hypothetical protein [Gemmatales bacterium]